MCKQCNKGSIKEKVPIIKYSLKLINNLCI